MMGNMMDVYGPRYGYSFLLLLTAPAIYCIALVTSESHMPLAPLTGCCSWLGWLGRRSAAQLPGRARFE